MTRARLPFDYARCANGDCPLRDQCLRFPQEGEPSRSNKRTPFYWFSPVEINGVFHCEDMIKDDEQ